MSKSAALAGLAAILALSVSGCAISGIKPAPGPATAAIAAIAAPTQPGHVPDADAVPMFSAAAMGYVGSPGLDGLIAHYSTQYAVPERLVRRVIVRESNYNSAARNGPYWGLMQISHATASGMGFKGAAGGLLDPETNLRYAVKYLAGAYVTAKGNEDQAMRFYASGYYYDAKRQGLLEKSGLR